MLWLIGVVVLLATIYYYLLKRNNYWLERGVKQGNPLPLLGHNGKVLLRLISFPELVQEIYNISDTDRYVGMYQLLTPTLTLRDPELIKTICVKDFDHFLDHRQFVPEDVDPLWAKNLFSLKGQKWREMRSTLSPSFTGSKMRQMFGLMSETGEQFANYFVNKKNNDDDVIDVELKDTLTRYCNDVIATAAFGVKTDSLKDRNNEFFLMGKEATSFNGFWKSLKMVLFFVVPKLISFFKITLFSKEVSHFFRRTVSENIKYREENNITRPDMLNLLMEARKNGLTYDNKEENLKNGDDAAGFATVEESNFTRINGVKKLELTMDDICAQALIFFFGGFDSVSNLMCFSSYELAINPDIQQRLLEEIDNVRSNNPKLNYDTISKMKYLDMVISETLRKWPNGVAVDRVCTKPYTIQPENPGEKPLHLNVGDLIWIPIWGIQNDPKYYPDPEKFDPERFNDENKNNIHPYTYLPFGIGPRNCIGSRFALLETKVLLFYLLSHFELVPTKKTPIPLVLNKKSFSLIPDSGLWVGLKPRKASKSS